MFVVFEGGEGAGKSTLARELATRLERSGRAVTLTREPGGTPAGDQVRELLHQPLTPWAESFAFLVARAQLVHEVIRPALARGEIVLCDRFEASTLAYQGYGRGLSLDALRSANRLATGGLEPDLTLFLDLDPRVGLARKRGEGEDDAIQTGLEDLAFHRKVRAGYTALAASSPPGAWITLDASLAPDDLAREAWETIRAYL